MTKHFRIRRVGGRRAIPVLTVPAEIARELDPAIEYICELTDDGILYRPVKDQDVAPRLLPSWATRDQA